MKKQSGSTLLIIMVVMVTLTVAVLSALNLTSSTSRNVARSNQLRNAREIGDGVIEYAYATWRERCRPTPNIHLTSADLVNLPLPPASLFPHIPQFQADRLSAAEGATAMVKNYKVTALDQLWVPRGPTEPPIPSHGLNPATRTYYYLATADVTVPTISDTITVNARRILRKTFDSPWNYAIFYIDDLEIHPGPDFNVTGWVHSNKNLYTAKDTLTFESKVTYGSDWHIKFLDRPDAPTAPNYNANIPPVRGPVQDPFGIEDTLFNTTDSNPNNDSYRELLEIPDASKPDPFADARYYNQADVKVIVNDNARGLPTMTILDSAGQVCTSASTGTQLALYNVYRDAVSLGDRIQDNRAGADVRLVTVDMDKVYQAMNDSSGPLYNKGLTGVVYVSDQSGSASNPRGVRLKNGAKMPRGGLTVATDNGLYIQGDYNTGTEGALKPNSNVTNGDPLKNTVPGYDTQSSAVLADAVMILSNAWTDANSYLPVNSRQASPTTVNVAIVSGILPTDASNPLKYSGGAENFPRFMEKWGGGTTFTYHGSMVELFKSQQHIGRWGKSNVYNPPRRKWFFDRKFYTNPPPGTLQLVTYSKGRWFQE